VPRSAALDMLLTASARLAKPASKSFLFMLRPRLVNQPNTGGAEKLCLPCNGLSDFDALALTDPTRECPRHPIRYSPKSLREERGLAESTGRLSNSFLGKSEPKVRETLMVRSPRKGTSRTMRPAAIHRDARTGQRKRCRESALLQRQRPSRCAGMRFRSWRASAAADAIALRATLELSSSLRGANGSRLRRAR
jgi:hypothetical protein